MNFQMAAELAADEGTHGGDRARRRRRGRGGLHLDGGSAGDGRDAHRGEGGRALAEEGAAVADVAAVGRRVNERSASFAVALTACTTPAAGKPGFDLPEDEMEVGVGIHGEPGRRREKLQPASAIAALAVDAILTAKPLADGDRAIVIVNGLGGTPLIELYVLFGDVAKLLTAAGVQVARSLVGNYVTSLDMAGMSVTVCKADDEILRLWDAPVRTPGLRWAC
jgi:dihydroxyacetone kinase-like protein